jgi:hypothetical protein
MTSSTTRWVGVRGACWKLWVGCQLAGWEAADSTGWAFLAPPCTLSKQQRLPAAVHGPSSPPRHPLQCFMLTATHRRLLRERYGVHVWHFEQYEWEAVWIPGGCPHQARPAAARVLGSPAVGCPAADGCRLLSAARSAWCLAGGPRPAGCS